MKKVVRFIGRVFAFIGVTVGFAVLTLSLTIF